MMGVRGGIKVKGGGQERKMADDSDDTINDEDYD